MVKGRTWDRYTGNYSNETKEQLRVEEVEGGIGDEAVVGTTIRQLLHLVT